MALKQSKMALGQVPVPSVWSVVTTGIPYEYVTDATLAAGDIIELGEIEAGVKPFNVTLLCDDLDTNGTPTITLSVGILNAGKTDLVDAANTFIAASTIGQTGGHAAATTANAYLSGASATARKLGIKVVAGPATFAGAGKKIAVVLTATS